MSVWLWYAAAVACFTVAVGAAAYAAFLFGYNLGWHERHADMVLPRNVIERSERNVERRPDGWASFLPPDPSAS